MRIACLAVATLLAACQPAPAPATPTSSQAVAAPTVVAPAVDAAPSAAVASGDRTGGISGALSYPSEYLPPMRICAFELAEATPYCVRTDKGQAQYRIEGVPPGDYLVLAFPQEADALPGGYTACVPDLSAGCGDHDLKPIIVAAGQTTSDINPADYYADAADWPQEPAR